MNAIFNVVSMEEFKRISNIEVAHTAWNILQTVHESTKAVKINKLQQLTSKFESIRMSDDESFDKFYAKLNDIVNYAYNLGEIYDQPKIVRTILRSLTENFRPKVSTLSKDKVHGKPTCVCHFCGKSGHIRPNCYKLQAAKRANKPKVLVPQAQDPIALIGELVKVLNLYSNLGVGNHSNVNTNSNARGASKKFLMQKTQTN